MPKHRILEPPSYIAWKDTAGFIHKREVMKSGNWCQYCWGPAHEKGFKCVYYNFCRSCLAFNPREKKYKDFALNKHMCNFNITEMPNQKVCLTDEVIAEQVFSEDRKARLALLEEKARVADKAAKAALEAKKKRKRVAEAFEKKKKRDRKDQNNWRKK